MAADRDTTPLDPYNNKFVISLADFIEHPLAHELVHNGQTLQVSWGTDAGHIYKCAADQVTIAHTKDIASGPEHTVDAPFPSCALSVVYHDGINSYMTASGLSAVDRSC